MINLDKNIIKKIDLLYESKNIPNIIFYGDNLTGKKTYLEYLLNKVYKEEELNKYILIINCAYGKGNIKYIRDNLKYFANTILNNNLNKYLFKSVILLNADKLTIDAQSALRRCIEIYNISTRFFIVVEDKYKILKPILSRFSNIYCSKKLVNNKELVIDNIYNKFYILDKYIEIAKNLDNNDKKINYLLFLANKLYNNKFSGNIVIKYINTKIPESEKKLTFLLLIEIYKKEIRDEIMIILFCLNFICYDNLIHLNNFI